MLDQALRAALRQAYNNSVDYRRALAVRDWREVERSAFLDQLRQAGAVSLLEIGAGPGPDSRFFHDQGLKLITSDLALENAFACRQQGLLALVLDACAIPFNTSSFDAVYSVNCLLHLPKREFPLALAQAARALRAGGLFYLGQYGGPDQESIWEEDVYQPPRFFSFFPDKKLLGVVAKQFEIVSFKSIPLDEDAAALHFQSLTMRKPAAQTRTAPELAVPGAAGSEEEISSSDLSISLAFKWEMNRQLRHYERVVLILPGSAQGPGSTTSI